MPGYPTPLILRLPYSGPQSPSPAPKDSTAPVCLGLGYWDWGLTPHPQSSLAGPGRGSVCVVGGQYCLSHRAAIASWRGRGECADRHLPWRHRNMLPPPISCPFGGQGQPPR